MTARTHAALILSAACAAFGAPAEADTKITVERTCPLCGTTFKATLSASGTRFGQRLDLRPVGAITSPTPVAVCTNCRFVLFKDPDQTYTADELATLRGVVGSDGYKALPADAPSYERLAKLYEALKKGPNAIAHAYLMASWQVENQAERNLALIEESRKWFDVYLKAEPAATEGRTSTEFLYGELLRRLGRFDEAKAHFDRVGERKEFAEAPFPALIRQQMALISAKDKSPKVIERDKDR